MRKIKGVMLLLAIIFVFSNGVGCTSKQEDKEVDNIGQNQDVKPARRPNSYWTECPDTSHVFPGRGGPRVRDRVDCVS